MNKTFTSFFQSCNVVMNKFEKMLIGFRQKQIKIECSFRLILNWNVDGLWCVFPVKHTNVKVGSSRMNVAEY